MPAAVRVSVRQPFSRNFYSTLYNNFLFDLLCFFFVFDSLCYCML